MPKYFLPFATILMLLSFTSAYPQENAPDVIQKRPEKPDRSHRRHSNPDNTPPPLPAPDPIPPQPQVTPEPDPHFSVVPRPQPPDPVRPPQPHPATGWLQHFATWFSPQRFYPSPYDVGLFTGLIALGLYVRRKK